jgi:hypothetical protein
MGGVVKSVGKVIGGVGKAVGRVVNDVKDVVIGKEPSIETRISPFAYKGAGILDELSNIYSIGNLRNISNQMISPSQYFSPDYIKSIYDTSIRDISGMKSESNRLFNKLFSNTYKFGKNIETGLLGVANKFDEAYNLVSNIDNIVANQLAKTNTVLAVGGLANTPALQRTQADIISSLNFEKSKYMSDILSRKAGVLEDAGSFGLNTRKTLEGILGDKYNLQTQLTELPFKNLEATFGLFDSYDTGIINKEFLPLDLRMKLAQAYFGVPVDNIVKPGTQGLLQAGVEAYKAYKGGR